MMPAATEPLLKNAMDWQGAYLDGRPDVVAFHAGPAWRIPPRAGGCPLVGEELDEWRAWLLPYCGPDAAPAMAGLDILADPRTRVVVTGQQAGIGLGPLYTLYKALAARHWAAVHEAATGHPTVPVFWVASDDHDVAEAGEFAWGGTDGRHMRQLAEGRPSRRAVHREPIAPQQVAELLAELEATTPATEFRPAVLGALEAALRRGDFEAQFVSLAARWLMPLGIVPVVPRLGWLRRRGAGLMATALRERLLINQHVRATGQAIAAMGLEAPLHRAGDETNLFVEVGDIRAKLQADAAGLCFATDPATGERIAELGDVEQVAAMIAREPGRFSPNAILRPLVQDHVLPTVAYVPGPTELVYHAQIKDLYAMLGVHRPALLPRPNVVLLEPRAERALGKLGVEATADALASRGALTSAIDEAAPRSVDAETLEADLAALEAQAAAARVRAASLVVSAGPALAKSLDRLVEGIEGATGKVRERLAHHVATADAARASQRERVLELVFPGGVPQERAVSAISPLLVNHGEAVIRTLALAINYEANGFQVISLGSHRGSVD